jgi:hypothetical protein
VRMRDWWDHQYWDYHRDTTIFVQYLTCLNGKHTCSIRSRVLGLPPGENNISPRFQYICGNNSRLWDYCRWDYDQGASASRIQL